MLNRFVAVQVSDTTEASQSFNGWQPNNPAKIRVCGIE
jgi:hypothetical protein